MSRIIRWIAVVCVFLTFPAALSAEDKSIPTISVMQKGANALIQDLEYLVKNLTNTEEQEQWKILKDFLDSFKVGVEPTQPLRIDVIYGKGAEKYIVYVPVLDVKEFRYENLRPNGLDTRRPVKRNVWSVKDSFTGYMSFDNGTGYAIFAEELKQVQDQPAPLLAIQPMINMGYDLSVHGSNQIEGVDLRHETFQENRKELTAAIKQRENETEEDFALRKMLLITQLDEIERFYAEIKDVIVGWRLDTEVEKPIGELELDFTAIEGSSLFKTIESINKEPGYFAAVPKRDETILSLRIAHPLDEMRKKNFIKVFENLRDRTKRHTEDSTELTDEEKAASKEIADLVFGVMIEGAEQGILDAFADVFKNGEKNTVVGGSRCVDQSKVLEVLKKIPSARGGQVVEMNVDKEGDIEIHKVLLNLEKHKNYEKFVGDPNIFIATNDKAIWYAAGANALEELKKVIQASGKEPTEDEQEFASLHMKLGPWLDLREQRSPDKGDITRRKMALEAFEKGDDSIDLKLWKEENSVKGHMVIEQGILSFVGKMIAEFSKENLDE